MRPELQLAFEAARQLPSDELPRLLGDLREIEATALARLTGPAAPAEKDELVDVDEAARRIGVSPKYLYGHKRELPFARQVGRRVLFSSMEIDQYIRQHGLTSERLTVYSSSRRKGHAHAV